jgi:hypothetical protein
MKTYYYLGPNNETLGPTSLEELRDMVRYGALSAATLVAADGDKEWRRWETVQEAVKAAAGETATGSSAPGPGPALSPRPLAEEPTSAAAAGTAGQRIAATSNDAFRAFRILATNPVAGLPVVCQSLDPGGVLGVGVTFGMVFMACALWSAHSLAGVPLKVLVSLNVLLGLAVPFVALAAASFLVRTVFGGRGSLGTDCFIAGAVLLPGGFVSVAAAVLGIGNVEIIALLGLFAACLTILMLYSGCHQISRLSERAATLAVPIMVLASGWLMKVFYFSMLQSALKNLGRFDKLFQ